MYEKLLASGSLVPSNRAPFGFQEFIMISVRFQCVNEWDPEDIIALYRSAGWWEEEFDPSGILPLIRGSYIFAVGVCEASDKAVAMGRILSDSVHTGYIHDLCVLTEFQGNQIGTRLLLFLVREGQSAGLHSLQLIAEPGTASFYEKSGFVQENNLIFQILNMGIGYEN